MILSFPAWRRSRPRALLLGTALGLVATAAQAQDAQPAAESAPSAAPAQPVAARHVDINEYFVEGNTILTDPEIEKAVYPFLGPDRTLDDVEKARTALQKVFEDKGYKTVFVEIPQQNVVGGRVRLVVSEAKVGKVEVTGLKHTSEKRITEALPDTRPGTVPNLTRFSTDLAALNTRSGDRQVTPQLKAGAQPGTVDVDLAVDDKLPLHGSVEFSNKYSQDTTRDRLAASLRYDDLWGLGHSISGYYSVAPERRKDAEVFVGSYGLPITDTLRLDITGLYSNSDVSTVGDTNVLGKGHSVTAVLTKTLPSHGGFYHRVTASVAYKDFLEDDSIPNTQTGAIDISRVPVTYYPVSLGYAGTLTSDKGTLGFDLTGTFAFRGLGSSPEAFGTKRLWATGGFAYLHGGVNYLWNLPKGAQLYTSIEGQVSNEPLINNEEMALGGEGSVRGYLQSEAIGDKGYVESIEFRTPSFAKIGGDWLTDLRAIAFVDAGKLWVMRPYAEQQAEYSLISVGTGLRVKFIDHLSGDLDLAFPLRSGPVSKVGDTRLHFRISADF